MTDVEMESLFWSMGQYVTMEADPAAAKSSDIPKLLLSPEKIRYQDEGSIRRARSLEMNCACIGGVWEDAHHLSS